MTRKEWEPVFARDKRKARLRGDHASTKHDPKNWGPVFRKDHASTVTIFSVKGH
jgi:hypothetical protein